MSRRRGEWGEARAAVCQEQEERGVGEARAAVCQEQEERGVGEAIRTAYIVSVGPLHIICTTSINSHTVWRNA